MSSTFRIDVTFPHTDADADRLAQISSLLGRVAQDDLQLYPVNSGNTIKYFYNCPLKCLRAVQRLNACDYVKLYVSEMSSEAFSFTNYREGDDVAPLNAA